jgi:hypothetical protein
LRKSVTRKQVYRKGVFGTVNATLCGRIAESLLKENDGMNIGDEITCKLRLKIQADPKRWRNRNLRTAHERPGQAPAPSHRTARRDRA